MDGGSVAGFGEDKDGTIPVAHGVTFDTSGNLYGTTSAGGTADTAQSSK